MNCVQVATAPMICLTSILCNFDKGLGGLLVICWVNFWQKWIFQNSPKWLFNFFRNKLKWYPLIFLKSNWHPPKKPVQNVAPLLKRKEEQRQKVTLLQNFKPKKLNTNTLWGEVELQFDVRLCPTQLKVPPTTPKCQ
jgi:hypothetical protein